MLDHFHFDSLSDLLSKAKKGSVKDVNFNSSWKGRDDFSSIEDVYDKFHLPWEDGMALFDKLKGMVDLSKMPRPKQMMRKKRWGEQGDDICVDRFRNGDESFWSSFERKQVTGPQKISLIVNVAGTHIFTADQLMWRGVSCAILADLFNEAGYQVDIYGIRYNYYPKKSQIHTYTIKDDRNPLDIAALINATSSWFFRIILFQLMTTLRLAQSQGSSLPIDEGCINAIQSIAGNGESVIVDKVFSLNQAIHFIEEKIKKFAE